MKNRQNISKRIISLECYKRREWEDFLNPVFILEVTEMSEGAALNSAADGLVAEDKKSIEL